MLRIKLARTGRKNRPFFRLIVSERERDTKGANLEILGHMDPMKNPAVVELKKDRIAYWIKNGAQPTDSVYNLLVDAGIVPGPKKNVSSVTKRRAKKIAEAAAKKAAS